MSPLPAVSGSDADANPATDPTEARLLGSISKADLILAIANEHTPEAAATADAASGMR